MSIDEVRKQLRDKRIEVENARNSRINWEIKRKDLLAEMVHVDSKVEEYFHKERKAVDEANKLYLQFRDMQEKKNEIRTDRTEQEGAQV